VKDGKVAGILGTARDVTDRHRAEKEINRQHEFLHNVLESLTHPFYVLDANDFTIKLANSAAVPGPLSPAATCYALTHKAPEPCDGKEHLCPLQVVKEIKKPLVVEHIHYDYEGNPRNVEVHAYPIFDDGGNVSQIIEYSFDITERKKMEEELRAARDELELRVRERTAELLRLNEALRVEINERKQVEDAHRRSEEKYRELVENANSIILRMDVHGNVTFFNEFAESFFGFSGEEILGRNVVGTIVPPADSSGRDLVEMIRDIIRHPERYVRNENENMRRDGERVWVLWTHKALLDADGRVSGILCIGSDITDRKKVEDALRLDEARLEALVELSRMAGASMKEIADFALEQQIALTKSRLGWLGFMDPEENVLTRQTCSKEAMNLCGIVKMPVDFPVPQAGLWADAVRERRPIIVNDHSILERHKPGYPEGHVRLSRLMVVPVLENGRIVALASVANKDEDYDATDVRQLTLLMDGMWKLIQRERAEKSLRDSERLAAMGRALSSVAHDMKTPLIAIGGFTRLVKDHLEAANPHRAKLDIVIQETRRLENMVRDMLDFSRPLELHLAHENIDAIIAESLAVIEGAAMEKRVTLIKCPVRNPPRALVDAMRIKQMVINLVMNAAQASPEGETVRICYYEKGKSLVIDVTDGGPGIPSDKREEVFSPFYTTKREGTGLGLPIIRKIVEAHEGRTAILDNPDRGITFRVEIPLSADKEKDA
jgi:PAS domain S-box-containing protein